MQRFGWRRMIAALIVAGGALAVPQVVEAQTGRISGIVTDAATGQPIEGVQVGVLGTGYGAITPANGRYFIVGVPPGTYTVAARRIGYSVAEVSEVRVSIDVTRELNFALTAAGQVLTTIRTVAPPTPLIEPGITGSSQSVSAEVIEALPVTNISGILELQQGFLQVPQNTDIVSFTESRRNPQSQLRIRGGRGGETVTLIDGIPVNNIVFGGPALDITTSAIQQIDFQKGGFEPQYGNALSGIINIATREGGTRIAGNLEYQGSGIAGSLGSTPDDLRGFDLYRGYLSGPIPGTADKLRFVVAGQQSSGADAVYEFDRDVYDFDNIPTSGLVAEQLDLFPGWRPLGYDQQRDIFGKLTLLPTNTSKLNLTVIDYSRDRQSFDFDYLLAGFDPFTAPAVNSFLDTLGLGGFRAYRDIVQGSIRAERQLYSASYEQRFSRSNLRLRAARFDQNRVTCNYFQGVCLSDRFADVNFNDRFVATGVTPGIQATGTDVFFGGEDVSSYIFRADLESQVTDHHNLQGGIFYQTHDLAFDESRNVGTNVLFVQPQFYQAKPFDAAAYIQDRIEYDFLTVKLGFRFDYAQAKGSSFADPLDPANGTTAREICNGDAPGLGATTPFTITDSLGNTLTGVQACTYGGQPLVGTRTALLDSAMRLARVDDFEEADPRIAFSPRIGVSFPLTERSSLFFNAGRYTQNPVYNSLYQNTGVGTVAGEEGGNICPATAQRPNSPECIPTLISDVGAPGFIGNPRLLLEQSTQYEVGYASEIGQNYALNFTFFAKDNTGLSGIIQSRASQDIGTTYAGLSFPQYAVLVNQDYATNRGIEVQFRRRISNFWGYDINYSFSRSTTNSPPPERRQEAQEEGDFAQIREITSEIDQPHVFNASLFLRADDRAPEVRFGNLLRNSSLTITTRAFSGLPYTPTRDFLAFGATEVGEPNTARGPMSLIVDLQAGKSFRISNVEYGVFTRVSNLLDAKNCVQVYPTTGRCDAGVIDQRRSRQGNAVNAATSSTFYDRPEFYGRRRQINAGVRASF